MSFGKFFPSSSPKYAPLSSSQQTDLPQTSWSRSHRRLVILAAIAGTVICLIAFTNLPSHTQYYVSWHFDVERDALNYGLSDDQCNAAFPDLYQELNRAREFYKNEKPIREQDVKIWREEYKVSHGQVHALIHNGQLIIIDEEKGQADRSRAMAALASIYRSLNAIPDPRTIPNIEFVIDIADRSEGGPIDRVCWSWCRRNSDQYPWVMPDFDGWSYPDNAVGSYTAFRENVHDIEIPWEDKYPQLVWRGSTGVAHELRMSLLNASQDMQWADVKSINWATRESIMPMQDFCKYQYVAHTEGNSWSGRLRYLQNCDSVAVIHELEYVAHYYPLLTPSGPRQNYVPVSRDFSDLSAQMNHYITHPEEARAIAAESARTFRDRYLTPAAEACYWRKMFRNYAEVQDFEPRLWDEEVVDGQMVKRQRRGQSFERFAFHQKGSMEHGIKEEEAEEEGS